MRRPTARAARWLSDSLGRLVVAGVLAGAWEAITRANPSPYFPPPSSIANQLRDLVTTVEGRSQLEAMIPTIERLAMGFGIAAVTGVVGGMLIGRSRLLYELLEPCLQFLRALPPVALIGIFVVLLGLGGRTQIALIAFAAIWPILVNTIEGVHAIHPLQLDVATTFQVSPARRFIYILLPAASPYIFAGLTISLSIALAVGVVAEMSIGSNGIGFDLIQSQGQFAIDRMWLAMVLIGLLGYLLSALMAQAEKRALSWHGAERKRN